MPGQARSSKSFTLDALTQLKDAGAVTATAAAQVGGSDRVLDFGNVTDGPSVELIAYTEGYLVADVATLDRGTGDEAYDLVWQVSDDTSGNGVGFDAGDRVFSLAALHLGEELGPDADPDADGASGRVYMKVSNERLGEVFRFARLAHVLAGTTPSINYEAFFCEDPR